jgi:hypothetical protein
MTQPYATEETPTRGRRVIIIPKPRDSSNMGCHMPVDKSERNSNIVPMATTETPKMLRRVVIIPKPRAVSPLNHEKVCTRCGHCGMINDSNA